MAMAGQATVWPLYVILGVIVGGVLWLAIGRIIGRG
jgi:hypothetical protein